MADNRYTFNELRNELESYIDNKTQWDTIVIGNMSFDKDAFKDIMTQAMYHASEVARVANGVSIIKDHPEATRDDVAIAVKIMEKGIENALPTEY